MNNVAVDRWIAIFSNFKARTTEEWGPDARMFVAIAKDGQGRSLPVININDLSREFCGAIDDGWTPVGVCVLARCDLGKEMGGVKMGIPAIHIGYVDIDLSLSSQEQVLYAELIADETKKFAKESANS